MGESPLSVGLEALDSISKGEFSNESDPMSALVSLSPRISTTPSFSDDDRSSQVEGAESRTGEATLQVKNTFLHYDVAEQPDAFSKKSRSGPAYLSQVGRELKKAASIPFVTALEESDDDLLLCPRERRVKFAEETSTAAPANNAADETVAADVSQELPSIGSVGHSTGECRPCAHSWREGGCSKGWSCAFCHLCGEDELKQKKRDKLAHIRDERRQQRASQRTAKATQAAARETRMSSDARREVFPAAGELLIDYADDLAERIEISWAVDLRRLRQQNRCGIIRRFPLRLRGLEVPFLLSILPSGAASFSTADALVAALQFKCVEPKVLAAGSGRVAICIEVAGAPPHTLSMHDFAVEQTCRLAPAFDLTAAADAELCVVRISLTHA